MPEGVAVINRESYTLLAEEQLPKGRRALSRSLRASVPSDPGRLVTRRWKLSGPIGPSREGADGFLGVDYADNLATDNDELVTSAMARNAVTLTGFDPPTTSGVVLGSTKFGAGVLGPAYAAGNCEFFDEDRGALFYHRQRGTTQLQASDMSVQQTVVHPAAVAGVAIWKDKGYLGLGIESAMMRRVTVRSGGSDYETVSIRGTPIGSKALRKGSDRLWMVVADPSEEFTNHLRYTLDDFVSASCSFAVRDDKIPATGIGTLGALTIVGNELGAGSFTDQGVPVAVAEPLEGHRSANNGKHFATMWGWEYFTTDVGLFAWNGGLVTNPVGPEANQRFEGPIDGRPTALWPYKDSVWVAYLTPAGDTYILRGKFGPLTAALGIPDWYPWLKLSSTEAHMIGSTGQRTNPTITWGEGTNMAYGTLGRRGRDIADSNYRFGVTGGTLFLTTLMGDQHVLRNLRYGQFHCENMVSGDSWQLAISVDEATAVNIGSAVTANGVARAVPVSAGVPLTTVNGYFFKPQLTQVAAGAGSSTAPPQIRGFLDLTFDERPDVIEEVTLVVLLDEVNPRTQYNRLKTLAEPDTASPVTVKLPDDFGDTTVYGIVAGVDEFKDVKGDAVEAVTVKIHQWELS